MQSTETKANSKQYSGPDRRSTEREIYSGPERRSLKQTRGPGIRRSDTRRSAEQGEMTPEQFDFIQAVNEYKRVNNKPFPTWTEVLDIVHALGYRKIDQPHDIDDEC